MDPGTLLEIFRKPMRSQWPRRDRRGQNGEFEGQTAAQPVRANVLRQRTNSSPPKSVTSISSPHVRFGETVGWAEWAVMGAILPGRTWPKAAGLLTSTQT